MASRAANGGGIVTPIPNASAQVNPNGGIDTGTGADWFGPGNPLKPMAPAEVQGRQWDIPVAYNLQQRVRAYQRVGFHTLRLMADSYDVLRLVIETRKDQIATLDWNITAKDKQKAKTATVQARCEKWEKFFQNPYGDMTWDSWLRMLLEDMFVVDAATLYKRPNMGGGLYGLKPLDGATIKPILDDWGDIPEPPFAGYQQILKGIVAVNYTKDQLLYRPRNRRTHSPYGYSPVEQVIAIVNIALRRENWQLQYFTEGNLPDALIGTPAEWTPDQIRNFQDWFDARLQGNTGSRRGATFVPGDVAKGIVQTKDTELFGKAEEWMARVICFAFSIPPSGFVQMVNRATAATAKETAVQEGIEPLKKWVKSLVNEFLDPDLTFAWQEEEEIDPKVQSDINDQKVRAGRITLNESREIDGLDPYDEKDVPEANIPMVYTTTGFVPVGIQAQIDQKTQLQEAFPPPPPPAPGQFQNDNEQGQGKPPPGQQAAPGAKDGDAGPPPKPRASGGGKGAEKADSLATLPPARGCGVHKAFNRAPAGAKPPITIDRPEGRKAVGAVSKAFRSALKATGKSVAKQVSDALKQKIAKADDPEDHSAEAAGAVAPVYDANKIVGDLDLSSLDVVFDTVEEALFDLSVDSAMKALAQVGARTDDELTNRVNDRAVAFARERAAELVGKRVLADGSLVDNPNAKWAITSSTRDMIRSTIADGLEDNIGTPAIADAIQSNFAFSADRAEMIAHTEVANANEQSKLDGYRDAQDLGIVLKKVWLTADDDDVDEDICEPNGDEGAIPLEDDFQSGDDAPPGHPRCRCVLVPVVEEQGDNDDEG